MSPEQKFGYDYQNMIANWLEMNGCFVIRKGKIPDIIAKVKDTWFWIECKTRDPLYTHFFFPESLSWSGTESFEGDYFPGQSIKYQVVK